MLHHPLTAHRDAALSTSSVSLYSAASRQPFSSPSVVGDPGKPGFVVNTKHGSVAFAQVRCPDSGRHELLLVHDIFSGANSDVD